MNHGLLLTLTAATLLATAPALRGADEAGGEVHIYVPRTTDVSVATLTLGDLCVVRAGDERLTARIESVAMGRAPFLEEALVLDRATLLARLGSEGLDPAAIRWTGAPSITVRRRQQTVPAADLLAAAQRALADAKLLTDTQTWEPVATPDDLRIPGTADLTLHAACGEVREPGAGEGRVEVRVSVRTGEDELGHTRVSFRRLHPHEQAFALEPIEAGAKITPRNCELRTVWRPRTQSPDWRAPFGMTATRAFAPDEAVDSVRATAAQPAERIVRKGQNLIMVVHGAGFRVTALGVALQDGRAGELIRVRKVDGLRDVVGRVSLDGTVTPICTQE